MKAKRSFIVWIVLLVLSFGCMFFADRIQRDNGNIEIIDGTIPHSAGYLTYKLYKPVSATDSAKAPAVLLLHGYQNDHETNAAYAIELAKRGVVVLSLDEYGHGATSVGLLNRGYTNHKVSVNYGNESVEDGTFSEVKNTSTERYRLMMNFSNLSFFNEKYTKDDYGHVLSDSSCGGIDAYKYLSELSYVDNQRMGISGHSMGTWAGWSVAAYYSGSNIEPKATVLQCGELFRDSAYDADSIHFNNVLLLQAKWDEFSYFRDYQKVVSDALLSTPLRLEFLDTTADKASWNTTFGSFSDGSARRIELLYTNHRLTTHHAHGLSVALDWFSEALDMRSTLPSSSQTAMTKEYLVLAAMLLVLMAMFPLMNLLLETPVFKRAICEKPREEDRVRGFGYLKGVLLTVLLSASTYPFMTQLGHALLPLPENIFRMTVGNGFLSWYLILIVIMSVTTLIRRINNKKKGIENDRFDFPAFLLSIVLVICLSGMVYLMNWLFTALFDLDLRFIWPFFRVFTADRAFQFAVYIPFFAVFYLLNNSKIMRDLRVKATYQEGAWGFIKNWLVNFLLMAGGVLLIVLLEYIPFFAEKGPGADLLFGSTFGGPFMSILILFVPQVCFFSLLCTYCYRKTGKVYTGALLAAVLACWIVTGGSAIL